MNKALLAALILGISIVGLSIGSTVPILALRLYQAGARTTRSASCRRCPPQA